jgi:hypothetical protein
MQMRGLMLLDDKAQALRGTNLGISAGLGCFRKIPFGPVSCKQLSDHANTIKSDPEELKVPASVNVPQIGRMTYGATCLLEGLA